MSGKTETSHEPTADELAAADEDADRADEGAEHHPGDIAGEAHGLDDHGEAHGHDDHAHAGEELGPVDTAAWGAFALGVAAGLVVALCLVITTTLLASPPPI